MMLSTIEYVIYSPFIGNATEWASDPPHLERPNEGCETAVRSPSVTSRPYNHDKNNDDLYHHT
jgi:hypothetical protein